MLDQALSPAGLLSRYSAMMMVLSITLTTTSYPASNLGVDYPNCVSAYATNGNTSLGCLSMNRSCVVFASTETPVYCYPNSWQERHDGHWCGFPIPPFGGWHQPEGVNLRVSWKTLSWECPYVLMLLLWAMVLTKCRPVWRFSLRDLLGAMALVAVLATALLKHATLPLILLVSLSTLGLIALVAINALWKLLGKENLLWPVVIQANATHDEEKGEARKAQT